MHHAGGWLYYRSSLCVDGFVCAIYWVVNGCTVHNDPDASIDDVTPPVILCAISMLLCRNCILLCIFSCVASNEIIARAGRLVNNLGEVTLQNKR